MTNRTRLEKLEKAIPADGSCPTCGHRRLDPMADARAVAALRQRAEAALKAGELARTLGIIFDKAGALDKSR